MLYKSGIFKLKQENQRPGLGELGLNGANLIYYNSGDPSRDRLPEYRDVMRLIPCIIDNDDNVLVNGSQFSIKQLYAIMNQKIQDGDPVRFIANRDGTPRLDMQGKITLVPYTNSSYKRDFVLDALEAFGTHCRKNPNENIDVDPWLDNYEVAINKMQSSSHDHDEERPRLVTRDRYQVKRIQK